MLDRSRQLPDQLKHFLDQLKQLPDLLKQLPDLLIYFKQTYKQMSKRLKRLPDQLKQLLDLLICFKQTYKQMSKRLKRLWLLLICFKQSLFRYLYIVSFAPKVTANSKASPPSAGKTPARLSLWREIDITQTAAEPGHQKRFDGSKQLNKYAEPLVLGTQSE